MVSLTLLCAYFVRKVWFFACSDKDRVDCLDDSVHRASTHVTLDSGSHKTIFSPVGTPRVLDNKVGVRWRRCRRCRRNCLLSDCVFAAGRHWWIKVPAFVKIPALAIRLSLVQIASTALCGHRFYNFLLRLRRHSLHTSLVTNKNDLVTQLCWLAFGLGYNSATVVSETITISIDYDSDRPILKLCDSLLCFAVICSVVVELGVGWGNVCPHASDLFISTGEVVAEVRFVSAGHVVIKSGDTLIFGEVPILGCGTSRTASVSVVLTPQSLVGDGIARTVQAVLEWKSCEIGSIAGFASVDGSC